MMQRHIGILHSNPPKAKTHTIGKRQKAESLGHLWKGYKKEKGRTNGACRMSDLM